MTHPRPSGVTAASAVHRVMLLPTNPGGKSYATWRPTRLPRTINPLLAFPDAAPVYLQASASLQA
jgi:hypothetical protein